MSSLRKYEDYRVSSVSACQGRSLLYSLLYSLMLWSDYYSSNSIFIQMLRVNLHFEPILSSILRLLNRLAVCVVCGDKREGSADLGCLQTIANPYRQIIKSWKPKEVELINYLPDQELITEVVQEGIGEERVAEGEGEAQAKLIEGEVEVIEARKEQEVEEEELE